MLSRSRDFSEGNCATLTSWICRCNAASASRCGWLGGDVISAAANGAPSARVIITPQRFCSSPPTLCTRGAGRFVCFFLLWFVVLWFVVVFGVFGFFFFWFL